MQKLILSTELFSKFLVSALFIIFNISRILIQKVKKQNVIDIDTIYISALYKGNYSYTDSLLVALLLHFTMMPSTSLEIMSVRYYIYFEFQCYLFTLLLFNVEKFG